ncbi:MAG: hypothetical protein ACW987_16830 [Candidatus Thorarchaeota archaeon]|jgi:hypothetical protein
MITFEEYIKLIEAAKPPGGIFPTGRSWKERGNEAKEKLEQERLEKHQASRGIKKRKPR